MNALIKKEKVIVTPLAGTTRDAIEEMINLKGIPLKIVDTAGILKPAGPIEEESVARSKNYLESADLIVLVLDNSQAITDEDLDIINRLDNKNIIVAINKIDLPDKINLDKVKDFFKDKRIVKISATKGKNLEKLEEAIIDSVLKGEVVSTQESIINSVRHKKSLKAACKSLEKAFDSMKKGLSVEFVVEDVREAIKYLGRITGQTTADEVLDNIFSKFCIGK
jgi:tRNA modification GTPase